MKDRGSWRTYRIVFILTLGMFGGLLDWIFWRACTPRSEGWRRPAVYECAASDS
jgi:hypothetical protein